MAVVVCSNINVKNPYFIRELNLHIYSYEELCYVIYENPLLIKDDFINDDLIIFIKQELLLDELSEAISKMKKNRNSDEDILVYILEYSDIFGKKYIESYKKQLISYRDMPEIEYLKLYGDYMFKIKKYNKAINNYEKILSLKDDRQNKKFIANVYNNLASAYANMFYYEKAYEYYNLAYDILKEKSIQKKIYYTIKLGKLNIDMPLDYVDIISFDEELEDKRRDIFMSDNYRELEKIFEYDRLKKERLLTQMIQDWKKDYRRMI